MIRLLSGDWLKLRKRWMPRILLFILLALVVLITWGTAAGGLRSSVFFPRGALLALVYAAFMMSFLAPVLAGSWAGNEYGWGTIRTVLSRRPDRIQFALSGVAIVLIAVCIALLALVVVASVEDMIIASVTGNNILATSGLPSNFGFIAIECFLATWYVSAFYVVLAYTFGTVFRSGAAGIGVGIGFTVAQTIVSGIFFSLGGFWKTMSEHFPGTYTGLPGKVIQSFVDTGSGGRQTTPGGPGIPESILGLGIYILVPLIVTLILIRNRDVTS